MLLLLDIDGVMIPAKGWKSPEMLQDGFSAFSKEASLALQSVLSDQVTVVLTTSYKSNFSIEEWKKIFANRGICIEHLQSLPHNATNLSRREEILDWFRLNSVNEPFVIIDDDKSLNSLPHHLKEHLVQTSSFIGLTKDHAEKIKVILQKKGQPV